MEQSLHISSKSRLRSNKSKAKKKEALSVAKAYYLKDYKLLLFFSDGKQRIIDFKPYFPNTLKDITASMQTLKNSKSL